MKVGAIISEYNPFHNGHLYQIKELRKNGITHIVAIMSGNYTQRGTPAIISKQTRANMAISSGVDLVLEIPTVFAVSCAQKFGRCGVYLANSIGCVDFLCFGSETSNLNILKYASKIDNEIDEEIGLNLKTGATFSKIRSEVILKKYGKEIADVFLLPNNILAIEYLKALDFFKSNIQPLNVKRMGCFHDSLTVNKNMASASYLRDCIESNIEINQYIPQNAYKILREELTTVGFCDVKNLETAILYKLRMMTKRDIYELPEISEGLENRICKSIINSSSLEELYNEIKTKRYPLARIRRVILSAFLNINKNNSKNFPMYIRVLGFNNKGKEILKIAKRSSNLPIVSSLSEVKKLKDKNIQSDFEFENRLSNIYYLGFKKIGKCNQDLTKKIIT